MIKIPAATQSGSEIRLKERGIIYKDGTRGDLFFRFLIRVPDSADAVGIHGTYADSSIGSAASHGCIRMHIKDVEALYPEVAVGMPVQFVA